VAEDREVWEKELRKVCREKTKVFAKSKERFHSGPLDPEDTWQRSTQFRKVQREHPRQELTKSEFT
jgi:hypothetical protein